MKIKRTDKYGVKHTIILTSQELEDAHDEHESISRCNDAHRHIAEHCEYAGIGHIPHTIKENLVKLCAKRFLSLDDCNTCENDNWEAIVEAAITEVLPEIEKQRAAGLDAIFATDTAPQKWYVAFFVGETENEYAQFSTPIAAIKSLKAMATDKGDELLEVHECDESECLPPKHRVYPYVAATYLTEAACGTVATCECSVCLTTCEVLNIDSDSLTERDFVVFEGSDTKHLVLPADEEPDATENILFWRR